MRDSRAASSTPSSRSNSQARVAFAVGLVAVFGILAVGEIEVLDQPPRYPSISLLVAHRAFELDDVLADTALQIGAPAVDDFAGGTRRRLAGELLARQQADRFGQRHIAALGHPLIALPAIALVEHRREIVG